MAARRQTTWKHAVLGFVLGCGVMAVAIIGISSRLNSTSAEDDTEEAAEETVVDEAPEPTQAPAEAAPTTVPAETTTTLPAAPPTEYDPGPAGPVNNAELVFFEDFVSDDAMSRFEKAVYHRDDTIDADITEWEGDHQVTGEGDLCGPPTDKRIVNRGERDEGFNEEWIYRCVPGGDLAKAHVMTSVGPTSGYSIGALAPTQEFSDVREVRWDVNQTDLGKRQWTEMALIPTGSFDMQKLPCIDGLPCNTATHTELGSVGTHWQFLRSRAIVTGDEPGGYIHAVGSPGYRCENCPRATALQFGEEYGAGDEALTSIAIRRQNYFRDNGDGTLTWGFELGNGSFNEFTVPGAFPEGPVRVVFKDHNYTPLKDPATLLPVTTFTWHWDNIQVYSGNSSS